MKKVLIPTGALLMMPMLASAQGLEGVLRDIGDLIDLATPIVVGLALLFFFWGLALYILNQSNEEKKSEGRNIMIWGIIAMFVMLSVFGIVRILQDTFNIQGGAQSPDIPRVREL